MTRSYPDMLITLAKESAMREEDLVRRGLFPSHYQWFYGQKPRDERLVSANQLQNIRTSVTGSLQDRLKREAVGDLILRLKQLVKERQELEAELAQELELEELEECGYGTWA